MKYLKLFVTLLVLMSLVATFAFAGRGTTNQTFSLDKKEKQLIPVDGSDIVGLNKMSKSHMAKTFDRTSIMRSKPEPVKNTSAVTPLAGTYTIPGSFPTIEYAVAWLNAVGVSADVTFELASTTYNEHTLTFGSYDGSEDFSVTIKPQSGKNVTINFLASTTEGKGFAFNGASNIHIDGVNDGSTSLTLQFNNIGGFPSGDPFGATIYAVGMSHDISVRHTTINGNLDGAFASQADGRPAIFLFRAATDEASGNYNFVFDSCTVINATFGLKILAEDGSGDFYDQNSIWFTHNKMGLAYGGAVLLGCFTEFAWDFHYDYNTIDGVFFNDKYWNDGPTEWDIDWVFAGAPRSFLYNFGQYSAGHVYYSGLGSTMHDNVVKNVHNDLTANQGGIVMYGLVNRLSLGGVRPLVYNNRITDVLTAENGAGQQIGFRTQAVDLLHNSIQLTGAMSSATAASIGISPTAGDAVKNNAVSNEMTGGTASLRQGVTAAGPTNYNYNAIYSTGRAVATFATDQAAAGAGYNANGQFGPVNFADATLHITTGPSSAEGVGGPKLLLKADADGVTRDTTAAGSRDAGAYEFNTGYSYGVDVMAGSFSAPPAGIPSGVPQSPKVSIKNNSATATSVDVTVTVSDGYSQLINVPSLGAYASQTLTFPNWTPASAGTYTFNATVVAAGDVNSGNDASPAYAISVSSPLVIVDTTYSWNASDQGWTRSIDWVRSNNFTKLGGPKDGYSMVTVRGGAQTTPPRTAEDLATYTEGAYASSQGYSTTYPGANILLSPWYNLSTISGTDLYLSFYQSLAVEGAWDRSWWEYTTDGATWNHIGVQDDPNGLNWYNTALYANAAMDRANFDSATAQRYGLWGIPAPTVFPTWTSNNDNASPAGWVYSQLKMTSADYPTRSANIRFRFIAFSDASTAFAGWAVDNVRFAGTPNTLSGSLHGQLFADLDGDGVMNNADTAFANTKVYLGRFGSYFDSTTTDGSGNYAFSTANLPATYSIKPNLTGYAYTTPSSAASTGIALVNHPADGSDIAVNMGAYLGSVSGTVVNDLNGNGSNDSEPGLSGYVVEVHKDSTKGTLVGSTTTAANGTWSMNLPPYATYVAKINAKTSGYQTFPASTNNFAVTGNSGTTALTGQDFGVFNYVSITVQTLVDLNGNGVVDGDVTGLPAGASVVYDFYQGSTKIDSNITIGNGGIYKTYNNMPGGAYSVVVTSTPSGWITTNGSLTHSFTVSTSGAAVVDNYLGFKLVSISGRVFEDANGDSLVTGDEVVAGRTVTITGNLGSSTVTDSLGQFSFIVGPGAHTLSTTLPSGWTVTKPKTLGGTFAYTSFSASAPGQDKVNQDFGTFETYSVSGEVFRDYNGDGVKNGADAGFDGVQVTLTGSANATTAGGGLFSFTSVGTGAKTLAVTAPSGFTVSFPGGGNYSWTGSSGSNVSGDNFGLSQTSDGTTKYRTFTADSLAAWAGLKATAFPKTGYAMPNIQVMYNELFQQAKDSAKATGIQVGEAGVKLDPSSAKSKSKAYLVPAKGSDVNATFYKKGKTSGLYQNGTARGLDFITGNASRIIGLQKNLSPDKHSNALLGNMLALSINIAASDWGKTPAGFGDLVYIGGGTYNNMSVADIASAGGELMTSWEGHAASEFTDLNAVVSAINAEFSGALDTVSGWNKTSKLHYSGVKAVAASSILRAGSSTTPRVHADQIWTAEPTTFELAQNYPNPFNPSTTISFSLPEDAVVTIKVFNMLGQEVATLVDNSSYFSGTYNETFDAKNLTSGVYFYRVTADITNSETGAVQHMTQTKKMLLTK